MIKNKQSALYYLFTPYLQKFADFPRPAPHPAPKKKETCAQAQMLRAEQGEVYKLTIHENIILILFMYKDHI